MRVRLANHCLLAGSRAATAAVAVMVAATVMAPAEASDKVSVGRLKPVRNTQPRQPTGPKPKPPPVPMPRHLPPSVFTPDYFAIDPLFYRLTQEKPFWEKNKNLGDRLRDDRAVLVSVRTLDPWFDKQAEIFAMSGVGWVRRDRPSVFKIAHELDRLKQISEHFQEVKWDPKTNRVFIIASALGYQARMLMAVQFQPEDQVRFKVIEGHFLGLTGAITMRAIDERTTEVAVRAVHEARQIPVPKFLMGFALEVVVQKVAEKMRTHFETAEIQK